jgi:hypothetical protein
MSVWNSVKRSLGMRVEADMDAARGEVDAMRKEGVEGRFAVVVGSEMARLSNGELRRTLPSMASDVDGPIPGPGHMDLRRLHVSKGVKAFADRYVEQGASSSVGPELGRAARKETLYGLADRSFHRDDLLLRSLPEMVDERGQTVEANTRAYLGAGSRNEMAIDRAASIMDAFDRAPSVPGSSSTRDAVATQVAMARAGLLAPSEVVRAANRHDIVGSMKDAGVHDRHPGEPGMIRIVPDFERGRRIAADRSLRSEAIERSRTSMTRIHPLSHSARAGERKPDLDVGQAFSARTRGGAAAIAASMSQGTGR